MHKKCFLGIDTSNYTTSAALVDTSGEIVANLKALLPVREGERGLRQSDAVFHHVRHLPQHMEALRPYLDEYQPLAVGVSATPTDAEGSYMPCFLVGLAAAEAFAAAAHLPLYRFSHQQGHLMAALAGAEATHLLDAPFGAFHVSGGTTDMLLVESTGHSLSVKAVGGSADLHAGQAVDRIGVAMGLSFPAGPALEALALQNKSPLPKPRICVRGGLANLSGLENTAMGLYEKTGDAPLVAAFVLRFLADTLIEMARHLRREQGDLPLLFSGGVMSNSLIAARLREVLGKDVYIAPPALSADNAVGTALLARAAFAVGKSE